MGMFHGRGNSRPSSVGRGDARRLHGLTFGPVPSRRFGRSLGINHLPGKVCSYSCVYCQVGRTAELRWARHRYSDAAAVGAAVEDRVGAARAVGESVDYLTFVPDGEPTLDLALGKIIERLKPLGIPIAVLTNGSLLSRAEVRAALASADHVSLKVDAVADPTWRKINRPHGRLHLEAVLRGMREFATAFSGTLSTETMLVDGVNDGEGELRTIAAFVGELDPAVAYLTVPSRPPAEPWVAPPGDTALARAYEVFRAWHPHVEVMLGYEGDAFASTGDAVADLLSITAVHPMREGAVVRLLDRAGSPWTVVVDLLASGKLVEVKYGSHRYYLRRPRGLRARGSSSESHPGVTSRGRPRS